MSNRRDSAKDGFDKLFISGNLPLCKKSNIFYSQLSLRVLHTICSSRVALDPSSYLLLDPTPLHSFQRQPVLRDSSNRTPAFASTQTNSRFSLTYNPHTSWATPHPYQSPRPARAPSTSTLRSPTVTTRSSLRSSVPLH